MARLTYAQKLAFAQTVAQFIRDNTTELKDGGFDPAKKLAELENELKSAVELDVQQEALKAKLVGATDKAVKALDTTYSQASSLMRIFGGWTISPMHKTISPMGQRISTVYRAISPMDKEISPRGCTISRRG